MNVARAGALLLSSRIASKAVMFVGLAYFAGAVGAANMGVFFLFQAIVGVASIPADFGIRGAIEKRISETDRSNEQLLAAGVLLKIVPFLLIVVALLVFRRYINTYVGSPIALLVIVALFVRESSLFFENVLRGELRVGETASLQVARDVTWVAASFGFLLVGYQAWAVILGWIVGYIVMATLGALQVSTGIDQPELDDITSVLHYAKYRAILQSGSKLFSWTDVFIIGFILSTAAVGAYEIAWRVAGIVILFSSTIAKTIFPQISSWDSKDQTGDISEVIESGLVASLLIVVPAFFGTIVLAGDILEFIFGAEYRVAWLALIILMGQKVVQVLYNIYGYTLQAMDFPKESAQATVVGVVANVALNVVLIGRFGLVGAALATTSAFLLNTYLQIRFLPDDLVLRLPRFQVSWILVSSSLMTLTLLGAKHLVPINGLISLLSMITFGGILYWTLICFNSTLRRRVVNGVGSAIGADI